MTATTSPATPTAAATGRTGLPGRLAARWPTALGVGAPIDDALHRDVRKQVGQTAGLGIVIAAFFVGEQEARVLRSRFGGLEAIFRIEQDGAGMRCENSRDNGFELAHHLIGNRFC